MIHFNCYYERLFFILRLFFYLGISALASSASSQHKLAICATSNCVKFFPIILIISLVLLVFIYSIIQTYCRTSRTESIVLYLLKLRTYSNVFARTALTLHINKILSYYLPNLTLYLLYFVLQYLYYLVHLK